MVKVAIEEIEVGERRREDQGDIAALAASIEKYGLIHPIVVDDRKRLVVGGRRLEACRLLGLTYVDVRDYGGLTEAERREIELEENAQRKDLTEYESSKEIVSKAAEIAPAISAKLAEKDSRGRKPKYEAPKEDIAPAIGTSETELRRAEQHVATADEFPFMQDWRQSQVLEAREQLQKIDPDHKEFLGDMLSEPGVPAATALGVLKNVAAMPAAEVEEIGRLYNSIDPRDRSLAKTRAAQVPPRPDPRSLILARCARDLEHCIEMEPDGALTGEFRKVIENLCRLREAVQQEHKERVK